MKSTAIILVAGGSGQRYGKSKLWEMVDGRYIFQHALDAIKHEIPSRQIFLVVPESESAQYKAALDTYYLGEFLNIVIGGATRAESVQNALAVIPEKYDLVLIHDAARPMVTPVLIQESIEKARVTGCGVIVSAPVTDTIKEVDGDQVVRTVPRKHLVAVQTPQVFDRLKLIEAYQKCKDAGLAPTDDAGAYEYAGFGVRTLQHTAPNFKITYPSDFDLFAGLFRTRTLKDYLPKYSRQVEFAIFVVSLAAIGVCFFFGAKSPLLYAGIWLITIANLVFNRLPFRIIWLMLLFLAGWASHLLH